MNSTALGTENKKKQTINFISEAHEKFYYEKLRGTLSGCVPQGTLLLPWHQC